MGTLVFLAGSGYPSVLWPKWPGPLPEPSLQGPWLLLRGALSQRAIGQLPCCGWHPQLNRLPSQLQAWSSPGAPDGVHLLLPSFSEGDWFCGASPLGLERPWRTKDARGVGAASIRGSDWCCCSEQPGGRGGHRGGNRCSLAGSPCSSSGIMIQF